MILRAIDAPRLQKLQSSPEISRTTARPIWQAIEASQEALMGGAGERGASAGSREQSARAKSLATQPSNQAPCWLITQPAHSALSGEIAAKLDGAAFGKFDDAVIRAIALHDAGWSHYDSELIRASRSLPVTPKEGSKRPGQKPDQNNARQKKMVPFLAVSPEETVAAWTGSIETALQVSGVGAYMVSEHFRSIAEFQAKSKPETGKQMAQFIAQEDARQAKLRPKLRASDTELQRLVDGLRFCDLLSLYICAGISDTVEFPQRIQSLGILLGRVDEHTLKISPSPFVREEMFSFAAMRHPRTKLVSSASFALRITA